MKFSTRKIHQQRPPVQFVLENVDPSVSYRLILFAVNAKGRSEPIIIDDLTFKSVTKIAGVSNVMNVVPINPVLAALMLTAAMLFAVVCIVFATIYRKHSNK